MNVKKNRLRHRALKVGEYLEESQNPTTRSKQKIPKDKPQDLLKEMKRGK